MLGHMALYEDGGHFGVEADRKEGRSQFEGAGAQNAWAIGHGKGMQVDDAMKSVAFMLANDPIAQGAEVIAQMDDTGGLDAR